MGGGSKNPIKRIVNAGTRVGAAVLTGGLTELNDTGKNIGRGAEGAVGGIMDEVSGKNERIAKEQATLEAQGQARRERDLVTAEEDRKRLAFQREDEARMAGSRSQTLLTGASGLEDDEDLTVSRRTLTGY